MNKQGSVETHHLLSDSNSPKLPAIAMHSYKLDKPFPALESADLAIPKQRELIFLLMVKKLLITSMKKEMTECKAECMSW